MVVKFRLAFGSAVAMAALSDALKKGVVHTALMPGCGGMMWYSRMARTVLGSAASRLATPARLILRYKVPISSSLSVTNFHANLTRLKAGRTQEWESSLESVVSGRQQREHGGWGSQLLVQACHRGSLQEAVGVVGLQHVCHCLAAGTPPARHLAVACTRMASLVALARHDGECLTGCSDKARPRIAP